MIVLEILAGLLVVVVITAFTGYFVAQEFAYMAADRSRLGAAADAGDGAAARALTVTRRTSFMLSGAQLGITVTGLLVGYVAEPLIGQGVGELLGGIGIGTAVGVTIGTVVAVVVSTGVQMVFGELFPKNLAIARPEPVARWLARSTTIYLSLFGWLIWLFDQSSNLLLKALKIEPVHDVEHSATPRDLTHIVAASRATGEIDDDTSTLLDRILDFPTRTADHAMVPRPRVDTLAADTPVAEVRARMATGHTRYPVLGSDPDDLRGIVSLHDLLDDSVTGVAADVARPAVAVPTSLPLPEVLQEMDTRRVQMVAVIDEYGGFAGILTREDVAEELLGDIADEHDVVVAALRSSTESSWTVRGDLAVDELERLVGHKLPAGDHETVAGAVLAVLQRFPETGETVLVDLEPDPTEAARTDDHPRRTLAFTVREVRRRVPAVVEVDLREDSEVLR
ncbi:hemolysin family protein [Williamsia serinedens]|uniref:Hemolysin, contains CBS domains n=1 Tax=Williamsia serinedens TaxID=391736 RepID=A0ABT1GZN6_9NOCA|nr:hemolysin family protein [Williamsia serinedens]MCP2159987.1 Hemolysin, contains CBS domains [Williamsia serinedens]